MDTANNTTLLAELPEPWESVRKALERGLTPYEGDGQCKTCEGYGLAMYPMIPGDTEVIIFLCPKCRGKGKETQNESG